MKGFVNVTTVQLQEAIDGFTKRFNEGKALTQEGIRRYHQRFYVEEGSWYVKWRFKNLTPREFARKDIAPWGDWDDVLFKVMTSDDCDKISFWNRHWLSDLDGHKAMLSESSDGFALVDSEMAKEIQTYRGFL